MTLNTKRLRELWLDAPSEIEMDLIDPGPGPVSSCDEPSRQCTSFYEEAHRMTPLALDEIERLRGLVREAVDIGEGFQTAGSNGKDVARLAQIAKEADGE